MHVIVTYSECNYIIENMKPLYRECKGSSVNKAEWSTFDCSLCKKFYDQVEDLPILCPDGYSKFRGKNLCFKIYHEKKNWYDAYKVCAESSSYMLNEPYDGLDIDETWLSYKYSYGKIQGVGIKPMNFSLANITARNHEMHCVSATLEKNTFQLKLENCTREISFVCIQNPNELVSSVMFTHTWTKVHTQRADSEESCYYFDKAASYSWTESVNICNQAFHGAELLHGIQDISAYRNLKKLIYQEFYEAYCDPLTWWMNFTHKNGLISKINYVDWSPYTDFDLEDSQGTITLYPDKKIYWTLDKADSKLKLACSLQKCLDNRLTRAYIEDRSNFEAISLSGNYYDYLKSFKLKCVPSGWFIKNSMRWYKDGVLLDNLSNEFHIKLPSNKLVTLGEALKEQGHYSCSVDQISPIQTVHSSEHIFKIPGIHTFVVSLVSQKKAYLADCPKYMFDQTSYEQVFLKTCFDAHFYNTVQSSYFLIKNLTCNSTHVNITVHVYFENEDGDKTILARLQSVNFDNFCEICDIDSKISVRSTVACYSEPRKLKNVTWPDTPIGEIAFPNQMCLTDEGKLLERRCLGDLNSGAVWSDISVDRCSNIKSSITKELNRLQNEVSGKSYKSLGNLPNLTAAYEELRPADVQIITQIFRKLADQESLAPKKLDIIVETMNNLIAAPPGLFIEAENSSNQIIESFNHIASIVDIKGKPVQVATDNIIVDIFPLTSSSDSIPNCIRFSNGSTNSLFIDSVNDLQDDSNDLDAGIFIPESLIKEASNVSDRLVHTVSKSLYHVKNIRVLSFVVALSFPNASICDLEKEEVTLFFKLNEKIDTTADHTPKCVFWDPNLNDWSYKGCFPRKMDENSVLCVCNHLTSFSVIMEMGCSVPPEHKAILHIITYIGCSLSCIGFCLIAMTFIFFSEWRTKLKNKVLFNLSISQFVFLFVFMIGIKATNSAVLCKGVAILLHYFLLASFAWMIVLAYTVYVSLIIVFENRDSYLIQRLMAFAWGVPIVIIIITVSCNHEYYSRKDYCWLSKTIILYGIIIPLASMLSINFYIFGRIFYANTCEPSTFNVAQDRRMLLITRAKVLLIISILLGLSWVFGLLALGEAKVAFEYLFSITTPLQGFLLAIFFVVRPKNTRDRWLRFLHPGSSPKSSTTHTINSTTVSHRVDNGRRSKYENMINSVVYRAHSPYTPYA